MSWVFAVLIAISPFVAFGLGFCTCALLVANREEIDSAGK
jgi:hypothetical protein